MVCGRQQGIKAADCFICSVLLMQNIGELQLSRAKVWSDLQQLAVKLFGFWPSLGFLTFSR